MQWEWHSIILFVFRGKNYIGYYQPIQFQYIASEKERKSDAYFGFILHSSIIQIEWILIHWENPLSRLRFCAARASTNSSIFRQIVVSSSVDIPEWTIVINVWMKFVRTLLARSIVELVFIWYLSGHMHSHWWIKWQIYELCKLDEFHIRFRGDQIVMALCRFVLVFCMPLWFDTSIELVLCACVVVCYAGHALLVIILTPLTRCYDAFANTMTLNIIALHWFAHVGYQVFSSIIIIKIVINTKNVCAAVVHCKYFFIHIFSFSAGIRSLLFFSGQRFCSIVLHWTELNTLNMAR